MPCGRPYQNTERQNARRGCRAKDRQIVDKNQLVDNGNAGHLLRCHCPTMILSKN